MRQLTRIARVSHAFYDIALPHLYRSAKPRYTQKSRDKLLRTLMKRPELGILIQRLSLRLSHEGETGPIADEIKSIRSTFDLITRSPLLTGDGPNLLLLYLMPRLQRLKITGRQ